jgi:hypothetical protein
MVEEGGVGGREKSEPSPDDGGDPRDEPTKATKYHKEVRY